MVNSSLNSTPFDDTVKPPANAPQVETPDALAEAEMEVQAAQRNTRMVICSLAPSILILGGFLAFNTWDLSKERNEAIVRGNKLSLKLAKAKIELLSIRPELDKCNDGLYKKGVRLEDAQFLRRNLNKCLEPTGIYRKGLCFVETIRKDHNRRIKNSRH